nr:uncharacterized protein LOC118057924 [Populus alba]
MVEEMHIFDLNPTMLNLKSPSRDSHDGEKTTTSFHSTPVLSPMGSPPHSHSSVGRHSRESSSSRFSGSLKPGSHKISPNDASTGGLKGQKQWKECDAIEEGLLDDEERRKGLPRKCYFLAFVLGFLILFSFFSLILWGASKHQQPEITMKSVTFEQFRIQAGSDSTGVATDMISVNSTVRMTYRNKGTFFGVHVTSTPMDLSYSEITLVPGSIKKFYQSRKSQRSVAISLISDKINNYQKRIINEMAISFGKADCKQQVINYSCILQWVRTHPQRTNSLTRFSASQLTPIDEVVPSGLMMMAAPNELELCGLQVLTS